MIDFSETARLLPVLDGRTLNFSYPAFADYMHMLCEVCGREEDECSIHPLKESIGNNVIVEGSWVIVYDRMSSLEVGSRLYSRKIACLEQPQISRDQALHHHSAARPSTRHPRADFRGPGFDIWSTNCRRRSLRPFFGSSRQQLAESRPRLFDGPDATPCTTATCPAARQCTVQLTAFTIRRWF